MRRRDFLAGTGALLLAGLPRPSAALGAADPLLRAQAKLNGDLVAKLAQARKPSDNVVISPASLAGIMAALALGADRTMQDAIAASLGLDGAAALETVRARVKGAAMAREQKSAIFTIANMVVVDPKAQPNTAAVEALRAHAAVAVEDLGQPATVARINAWAAEQTRGFIPQVIEAPQPDAGLVGINALYFKGQWASPFEPQATRPRPFHAVGGGVTEVPLMAKSATLPHRRQDRFAAVELPYRNDRFALTLVTTTDKPAAAAEFAPVAPWLAGEGFDLGSVDLALPRFTMREGADLLAALDALGLKAGHRPSAFAPLARTPLAISRIAQQAYLKVDEQGTEAAASTTVVAGRMALRSETVSITLDKPFLFALRDRDSGLLLMSGYIGRVAKDDTLARR
jgi:serpin B